MHVYVCLCVCLSLSLCEFIAHGGRRRGRAISPFGGSSFPHLPHPEGYTTLSASLSLSLSLSLSPSYFSELETRTPLRSAAVSESTSAAASVTTKHQSTPRTQRGQAEASRSLVGLF
jgi:hypothetical protein